MNVQLELLVKRYPVLNDCLGDIQNAYSILETCFGSGRKLLVAGNGGSCADSEHIVGELMKGFMKSRKCDKVFGDKLIDIDSIRGAELSEKLQGALPAISLNSHGALNTAYSNDVAGGGVLTFAQQVYGYGNIGDVFFGISTSGNSKNIMHAAVVAKAKDMKTIGLTGQNGGELSRIADVAIRVPETETYMVQELHLPVYHCLCLMLEEHFF